MTEERTSRGGCPSINGACQRRKSRFAAPSDTASAADDRAGDAPPDANGITGAPLGGGGGGAAADAAADGGAHPRRWSAPVTSLTAGGAHGDAEPMIALEVNRSAGSDRGRMAVTSERKDANSDAIRS